MCIPESYTIFGEMQLLYMATLLRRKTSQEPSKSLIYNDFVQNYMGNAGGTSG
jgi:hypothetical protein